MSVLDGQYTPVNPREKGYFDYLWSVANPGNPGDLSGKSAVSFFQRSGVNVGFLKQIWSLSTPVATMNLQQFYTALRYITMIQSGELPISKEKLSSSAKIALDLPKFTGIDLPKAPAPTPVPTPTAAPVAGAPPNAAAYAIMPQDHVKYHGLFCTYDSDKDGYLTKDEAMNVFRQSRMDPMVLEKVFVMSDDDRDLRLNSKEFCAGFHLILCISKKGLPVPPSIPPPLKGFIMNAPMVPGGPPPNPVPAAAPTHTAPTPAPAAAPAPTPAGVSDAFAGMDQPVEDPVSTSSVPAVNKNFTPSGTSAGGATHSSGDVSELAAGTEAITTVARKALAAHEETLDSTTRASSSLSSLKQRLAMDRISLEASVKNAQLATQQSSSKLAAMSEEIRALIDQQRELRTQLEQTQNDHFNVKDQLAQAQQERDNLRKTVFDLQQQMTSSTGNISDLANQVGTAEAGQAGTAENISKLQSRANFLTGEAAELQGEISTLRTIVEQLSGQRNGLQQQESALAGRLKAAQSSQQQSLAEETKLRQSIERQETQVSQLKAEKKELINTLQTSSPPPGMAISKPTDDAFSDLDSSSPFPTSPMPESTFSPASAPKSNAPPASPMMPPPATKPDIPAFQASEDPFGEIEVSEKAPLSGKEDQVEPAVGDNFAYSDAFSEAEAFGDGAAFGEGAAAEDPFADMGDSSAPGYEAFGEPSAADPFSDSTPTAADPFGEAAFSDDTPSAPPVEATLETDPAPPVKPPKKTPKPIPAVTASTEDSFASGDAFGGDAFGGSDAFSGSDAFGNTDIPKVDAPTADDAFGSAGAFDAFGGEAAPAAGGFDAFGDPGAFSAPVEGDGFGNFDSFGGFDAFSKPAEGGATEGTDDPFADFN